MTKFQTVTTVTRKSESQQQKPICQRYVCAHGRRKSRCKDCGGSRLCEHGRRKCRCKDCRGIGICEHGRVRSQCKDCGGSGICEHGRIRSKCKDCGGSGSKTINRGRKRKQSDSTDENIANISANEGRNFTIV